jgi:hypothetical protein
MAWLEAPAEPVVELKFTSTSVRSCQSRPTLTGSNPVDLPCLNATIKLTIVNWIVADGLVGSPCRTRG